jgi:SAM-dependent methyltransferase
MMGASRKNLERPLDLKKAGAIGEGSRMLELGLQDLSCDRGGDYLAWFVEQFRGSSVSLDKADLERLAVRGTMSRLMKLCGIDYLAIDIVSKDPDIVLFDLNTDPVPDQLRARFDLVTNLGTTEHVFDQYRSFLAIHEFTKPGGIVYHDLPMGGYFYHGLFSYTPLFFDHLARANEYDILFRHFSKVPAASAPHHPASNELKANGWPDPGYHDIGVEYIFRRTHAGPFRIPIEESSDPVDQDFLKTKRSDIVILPIP